VDSYSFPYVVYIVSLFCDKLRLKILSKKEKSICPVCGEISDNIIKNRICMHCYFAKKGKEKWMLKRDKKE